MKIRNFLALFTVVMMIAVMLCGCGKTDSTQSSETQGDNETTPSVTEPEAPQRQHISIAVGSDYVVGVKPDGTAIVWSIDDNFPNCMSDWSDIIALSTYYSCVVGLKADGSVVVATTDDDDMSTYDTSDWSNIVAVDGCIGLKADGTALVLGDSTSDRCKVSNWTDIIAISAGKTHTVGLKSDGTVVSTYPEYEQYGQTDVLGWTDIVAVSAGSYHTVGLKADGTVVSTTVNEAHYATGQSNVSNWTDIVAIAAGDYHTVGLKADGTVVATSIMSYDRSQDAGQDEVSDWTDIVAIAAGQYYTIGIKADGSVVSAGFEINTTKALAGWTLLLPDGSNAEPKEAAVPSEVDGLA